MAFKNIMIPYDMSESSENALDVAKDLLKDNPAREVHVVYVASTPDFAYAVDTASLDASQDAGTFVDQSVVNAAMDSLRRLKEQELKESVGDLEGLAGTITQEVTFDSSPTAGIVNYAHDNNCDLIIMGSRGLGAIRGMLGSVSYGVLRAAAIPVLIVK